jgi:hypothetical protein
VYHLRRRRYAVGQQPAQAQPRSLTPRKGDRSVQCLVAQNFKASFHDLILLASAIPSLPPPAATTATTTATAATETSTAGSAMAPTRTVNA